MRYNRLTDLGLTEAQIQRQPDVRDRQDRRDDERRDDARRRQGLVRRAAARPLGRGARARRATGSTTTFSASTGTTQRRPAGTTSSSRTSRCRTCCAELGGTNRLVTAEFKDHEQAQAAALAGQGHRRARPRQGPHVRRADDRRRTRPARSAPSSTSAMVADLVNFLDYMGEPAKNKRMQHRHRRAALPRRAVRFRLLDEARVLEGRALEAPPPARGAGRRARSGLLRMSPLHYRPRCPEAARRYRPARGEPTHDDALFRDHRPLQPALPHRAAREGHGFPDHRRRPRPQARGPRGDEPVQPGARCWSSATSSCTSRTSSTSTSTSASRIRS